MTYSTSSEQHPALEGNTLELIPQPVRGGLELGLSRNGQAWLDLSLSNDEAEQLLEALMTHLRSIKREQAPKLEPRSAEDLAMAKKAMEALRAEVRDSKLGYEKIARTVQRKGDFLLKTLQGNWPSKESYRVHEDIVWTLERHGFTVPEVLRLPSSHLVRGPEDEA